MTKEKNQEIINLFDRAFKLIAHAMFREELNIILLKIKCLVLNSKTEDEIKTTNKEWEDIYACYVIRTEGYYPWYIMETSEARWATREGAARFTKQQATNFIEQHKDEKFIIEDAK